MLWCVPSWVQLLWYSLSFLDFLEVSFLARLGKFFFNMFSYKFSISCSSASPSGTPIIQILECFRLSQRFLSLSSFFKILFPSCCSYSMLFTSLCSKLLIWILAPFPSLLVPYGLFFISLSVAFIFCFMFLPYSVISVSVLITSVLNSAPDSLPISSMLSSFSRVLICFFIWAIFLCLGAPVTL